MEKVKMAKCNSCGSTIIMGGVSDGEFRFCNDKCHYNGYLQSVADQIPENVLEQEALRVHAGCCPVCQGSGPVDVHVAHKVYSVLLMTSWESQPFVCCKSCGVKKQGLGAAFSFFAGWWGFPWGLVMTPVQVIRNIVGMLQSGDSATPSEDLRRIVSASLAEQLLLEQQQAEKPTSSEFAK
jgi:hypothetical protein